MHSLPVIIAQNAAKPAVQVETVQRRDPRPVEVVHIHVSDNVGPIVIIADQDLQSTPFEEMAPALKKDAEVLYAILYDLLPATVFRELRRLITEKKEPQRRV